MKKALLFAGALALFGAPAFAQQSPTGQSSGGPARVGIPGQVDGGVPGSRPGMAAQRMGGGKMMMRKKSSKKAMKRKRRM